MKSCVVLG